MAFTEVDEKLLVRAYQAGDERAFDTIVRTQYDALFAHAMRRLSQHEAAEDAVQDTLLRAYRALPKLDGDLALRAWLHRILTNVCHDEGNRRRRQVGLEEKVAALPEEYVADPGEEAALHDTVRVMSEALAGLPESYREALVLRYVDGLSFREVAEATGVTEENARARVHRGRIALHKILSRVVIILAFLIPGLRRTQHATAGVDQAAVTGVSEQSVHLVTQLTTHAVNAAPAVSRFAEFSASLPGGKSALVTTAVAAVAAVSVPVAAYTVNEVRQPPQRPPAAVAPPAEDHPQVAAGTPGSVPDSASAPFADLPPEEELEAMIEANEAEGEQRDPAENDDEQFGRQPEDAEPVEGNDPSDPSTAPTPPTDDTPPADEAPMVEATLEAAEVTAAGGPDFEITGNVVLQGSSDRHEGVLSGKLSVYDDDTAAGELLLSLPDGSEFSLRIKDGVVTQRTEDELGQTYTFDAKYKIPNGGRLGVGESGTVTVVFQVVDGGPSHLRMALAGR